MMILIRFTVIFAMSVALNAQSWSTYSGQKISAVCPANGANGSVDLNGAAYPYQSNPCSSVVRAWGSAWARIKAGSEMLCAWGGGHSDGGDNSVYCFTFATGLLTRVTGPSTLTQAEYTDDNRTNPDGTPKARHDYEGLVYIPGCDCFLSVGGGVYGGNGYNYGDTWILDPATWTWTAMDPTVCGTGCNTGNNQPYSFYCGGTHCTNGGPAQYCGYNPNDTLVWCNRLGVVFTYTCGGAGCPTNTYTRKSNTGVACPSSTTSDTASVAIDTLRNDFYCFGGTGGFVKKMSMTSGFSLSNISVDASCPSSLLTSAAPGAVYVASMDRILMWPENGGNTIYWYNPADTTCTSQIVTGGPPNGSNTSGLFKRFAYFSTLNKVAIFQDYNVDTYTLNINPSGGSGIGGNGAIGGGGAIQ